MKVSLSCHPEKPLVLLHDWQRGYNFHGLQLYIPSVLCIYPRGPNSQSCTDILLAVEYMLLWGLNCWVILKNEKCIQGGTKQPNKGLRLWKWSLVKLINKRFIYILKERFSIHHPTPALHLLRIHFIRIAEHFTPTCYSIMTLNDPKSFVHNIIWQRYKSHSDKEKPPHLI